VRFLFNDDLSLALETRGSGPRNVLFVHGWISSRRIFYDVVDRLDPERITSHLLDLRGSGVSDRAAAGHDVAGYASDLRAALADIGEPVDVVAHSMGGKIAQFVALDPPPNLRRLILFAPATARAVPLDPRHRALTEKAFGSRARIARFQRAAMVRELPSATLERLVEDALVAQREGWFGWYDRGRAEDFSDRLASIAVPTIVVAGERDPLAQPARVRRDVADMIPGATYVEFKNVGHNIPVEMPAESAHLIDRAGS
jgi:pimeloyl-ACP methyl ester carboxylesterase